MIDFAKPSREAYNQQPEIADAIKHLDETKGMDVLENELKEVIQRNGAFWRFGISLLHLPFDLAVENRSPKMLERGHRMVNFGNVAYPANFFALPQKVKIMILPTSWVFRKTVVNGQEIIEPVVIEYTYSVRPQDDALTKSDEAVLMELGKVLVEKRLNKVFAVTRVYPGVPGITFRSGGCIITVPEDLGDFAPGQDRYPCLWVVRRDGSVAVQSTESGGRVGDNTFGDEED